MEDYETIRSGVKSAVNNWGYWLKGRTLNGDMLEPWAEDMLTYEVYVRLYWYRLPTHQQHALTALIEGGDISMRAREYTSRAITDITHFMLGRQELCAKIWACQGG